MDEELGRGMHFLGRGMERGVGVHFLPLRVSPLEANLLQKPFRSTSKSRFLVSSAQAIADALHCQAKAWCGRLQSHFTQG